MEDNTGIAHESNGVEHPATRPASPGREAPGGAEGRADRVDPAGRKSAGGLDAKGRPRNPIPRRVPWLEVGIFVATAVILGWLVCLPLWLSGDGLQNLVVVQLCGQALMLTPLLATILALIVQRRRAARARTARAQAPPAQTVIGMQPAAAQSAVTRYLGIWPLTPARRVVGLTLAALFGTYLLVATTYLLAAAFGWFEIDLVGLSGFKAQLSALPGLDQLPIGAAIAIYLAIIVFNSIVTAIFAFGEEVGWRGWLLTSLRPLGTWPALLIIGVIWGLWHAPLILLGYNFGRTDISGLGFMLGGCVMLSFLFGWLRLRSGSLWPAVFAHGALNGSSAMLLGLFADASAATPDMALVTVLGVSGWIVSALIIAVLVLTGQFRHRPELGRPAPNRPESNRPEPGSG
ncbi:CPBP family intramembrane glutamic endopeptidase [Brevibacterium sp.]|uniref:CPBP family intramembrane glutamic endopeptidase n=1 Tax=Brevibacterium sp. TaxID=1701 RepID=UPI002810C0C8|nr:CPBP family intramembrane glutamic endopeptidase [Brevibacterium sp.]